MLLYRLSYGPYNEGKDMKAHAIAYRHRYGHYLQVICADQIYRTRSNRAFCQGHGIRLSGPRLGRPINDPQLVAEKKKQFADDKRKCNAVEGKRRYGLDLIREKLATAQDSTIALTVVVLNLEKLLELLFVLVAFWLQLLMAHSAPWRSRMALISDQPAVA